MRRMAFVPAVQHSGLGDQHPWDADDSQQHNDDLNVVLRLRVLSSIHRVIVLGFVRCDEHEHIDKPYQKTGRLLKYKYLEVRSLKRFKLSNKRDSVKTPPVHRAWSY